MSVTRCHICRDLTAPCGACMSAHLQAQMPKPITVGLYENPEDIRAKFAALTAERDSLKQQCGDLNVKCLRLEAEVKRQQAIIDEWAGLVAAPQPTSAGAITYVEGATYSTCQECARLREALEKYGSHLIECENADTGECNCGYRAALSGGKA